MGYLILKNPYYADQAKSISENSEQDIKLDTLLDEMKLELFLEKMNEKSMEEIEIFFNKKND